MIECASLYKLSLKANYQFEEKPMTKYSFRILSKADQDLIKILYAQKTTSYLETILSRLSEPDRFICFGLIEDSTGVLVYARWACKKYYYMDPMRMNIVMQDDEILTLDSYTHPDFRMQGLHTAVFIRMINWFIMELKMRNVYVAIRCFLPHLAKLPKQLGFKKIKTVVFLKRK